VLPAPLDTILFESRLVTVGAFHAPAEHPRFHDSGPIQGHLFVFPRTGVWIRHEGGRAFVADPNVVTFYNRGQVYWRGRISESGDRCEWFRVAPEALIEALARFEPAAVDRAEHPFRFSRGRSSAGLYARQRRLVRALRDPEPPEPLEVEETTLALLDGALAGAFEASGPGAGRLPATERRHRDLAEAARALLASTYRESLRLSELAARLDVAPGHLCRVFSRQTGRSLHAYRDQLRLRSALEEVPARRGLTELALDLGYSSHSHFTAAFRRAFGLPPSRLAGATSPRTAARG
jgi:AraC-like DNA-binding protein